MHARWWQYVLGFLLKSQVPQSSISCWPHRHNQHCWFHFGALDWTSIADAVTATRTGSFMDGFATPTNCKIDGGNPWQATQYRRYLDICVHPELWPATFSSQTWLTITKRLCITTASSRVSSHAWRVHCITPIVYDVSSTGYDHISAMPESLTVSAAWEASQ